MCVLCVYVGVFVNLRLCRYLVFEIRKYMKNLCYNDNKEKTN